MAKQYVCDSHTAGPVGHLENCHYCTCFNILVVTVVTHIDGSCRVGFLLPSVCLFFHTISQKPMQLGSPNLT